VNNCRKAGRLFILLLLRKLVTGLTDCSLFGLVNAFQWLIQNTVNNSLWCPEKVTVHKKTDPKLWHISSQNIVSSCLSKNGQSWVLILENEFISQRLYAMFAPVFVGLLARLAC